MSNNNNTSQLAAYIWSLADLLRGDFKQSQYGRVILPFTILRRLECVLEGTKAKVLKEAEKQAGKPEEAREKFLLKAAGQPIYNSSPMDLSKLGSTDIGSNLQKYVASFSRDAREIFEHFKFDEFVRSLSEANLLFKVVQRVAAMDLHPEQVSNHDMGLVFEELIRKFAEGSNETAGEHFTPRDIVRLTTSLVFMEDDEALRDPVRIARGQEIARHLDRIGMRPREGLARCRRIGHPELGDAEIAEHLEVIDAQVAELRRRRDRRAARGAGPDQGAAALVAELGAGRLVGTAVRAGLHGRAVNPSAGVRRRPRRAGAPRPDR